MVRNIRDHTPEQKNFNYTVGRNINYLRKKVLGWTQKDFASQLGITFQQLQKYESCTNACSGYRFKQIADKLGVSMDDLCDPSLIAKRKALAEAGALNGGVVKAKDFQNNLAEQYEEQFQRDDFLDAIKGRL